MVNPSEDERVDADDQLHELIAEYHDRVDQGETLDPVGFTAEHPELEAELSRYFENVATVESLAGPTASQVQADPSATVISGETHDGGFAETMIENSSSGNAARISKDAPLTQFGRYRIRKELGRGAMGAVYLAHDEQLDREVALKIPKFETDENQDLLERFYREARAAAALQHPGICPVHDVGELDGQHYITMAFIKGRPLRDFTKSSRRQKGKQVARVIRKIAMAMAEAHEHNVVHRDLKPANIMINEKNEPVVMDFGLARRSAEGEEQLTHTGTVIGTPAYMSPEQVDGDNENVGPHSDIYSLGVIFYEMLTGQLPFQGNLMSILKQIALTEPKPPVEIHADIDPSLQGICLKMMAKKSEDRPDSMSDVARDLTMWLQGRQVVADEAEPLETSRVPGQSKDEEVSATTPADEPAPAIVVAEPEATLSQGRKRSAEGSPPDRRKLMIAGSLGGAVILLGAIVFFVRLGKVNVEITIDDPSLALKVDDGAIVIEGEGEPIRLSAGPHKLQVERDGLEVATEEFVVKKDGKNAIRVAIVGSEVLVLKNGQKPPESNPHTEPDNTAVAATTASRAPAEVGHSGITWRPLFNGHSLDGWKRFGSTGNDWRVENGMLVGDGDRTSLVYTRETFSDFDVRVECRLSDQANAGLYLRCNDRPGPGLGFEAQLAGRNGLATGGNLTGSLFFKAEFKEDLVPANEWFVLEARCRGPRITLFVNGRQTIAYVDSTNGNRTGAIGLQSWAGGHKVEFRKIEIREATESLQAADGLQPLLAVAPFDADQAKAHQQAWADYLGVPVEYTNSIGIKFRLMPPGEFTMGSSPDEIEATLKVTGGAEDWRERVRSEGPQHKVVLTQPVYVGITEVTQTQYEQVMGNNPSHFSSAGEGKEAIANLETGNHPVEMVSGHDAVKFCAKLSLQEKLEPFFLRSRESITPLDGTGYRLLTEAEWEAACRAGTSTRFWSGDAELDLNLAGWFGSNSGDRTHATCELKANAFGLFDVHGNVREWVLDSWDPAFYGKPEGAAAIAPLSPYAQGSLRVIRGGSWHYGSPHCRSSNRYAALAITRTSTIGFRVVLPVDAVRSAIASGPTAESPSSANAPPAAVAPFDTAQAKTHQQAWADYLGVPVEKEVELPGGETMTFMLIPPGEFVMGSSREEIDVLITNMKKTDASNEHLNWMRGLYLSEGPQHKVVIRNPFWLAKYEVTRGQFRQFVSAAKYNTDVERNSKGTGYKDGQLEYSAEFTWSANPGFEVPPSDKHPVSNVSWNDASTFCDWLSQREDINARLPNEAEWEFACRAGTTTSWSLGDAEPFKDFAWHGHRSTDEVGRRKPNPFGLHDMHGNVAERCFDWYAPYSSRQAVDPSGPNSGDKRVQRGGAFTSSWHSFRSAHRRAEPPDYSHLFTGFRVAIPIDQAKLAELPSTDASRTATVPRNQAELMTSPDWTWSAPAPLPELVNHGAIDGSPSFSSDGNMLLFGRRSRNGSEGGGLMVSTRSSSGEWASPRPFAAEIKKFGRLGAPYLIVEEGKQSLYLNGVVGDAGVPRLFVSHRESKTSTWSTPESLGDAFDGDFQDQAPSLSADGCVIVFHAHRRKGVGKTDIFVSSRPSTDAEWSTPIHAGREVNTKAAESHPCLSSDGLVLMFLRTPTSAGASSQFLQSVRRDRNSAWETPTEVSFSNDFSGTIRQPALSPDGTILIFSTGADLMISHRIDRRELSDAKATAR